MTPKKTKAAARNRRALEILTNLFNQALKNSYTPDESLSKDIEVLFNTQHWGLREIVFVVCMARLLDMNFKASEDFYACNPRPLFEESIKPELDKRGIPSRKSGPLNMAKGAKRIDEQWASGRKKSRAIADRVVLITKKIERMSIDELENFTKLLMVRFLKEATIVEQLNVELAPNAEQSFLYKICELLINKAPDCGNTPQRIVGYLLESYHEDLQTGVTVSGHTDSASTTSTTSKKLGDITEQKVTGCIALAYEVTVKKFGPQRVREAYESARAHNAGDSSQPYEMLVICRRQDLHSDVKPVSNLYLGKLEYQDMVFHFIDIYEWMMAQLLRLSISARLSFFAKLQEYVFDKNTSSEVKYAWAEVAKTSTT